jgi:transcriptional regulator with XRE-family HTH domain
MDENILGKRLRYLREKSNLKQKEIAKKLNLSDFQLSRYENGKSKPDPLLIARMARFYGTTTDYLLGLSNHPQLTEKEDREADKYVKELMKLLEGKPDDERARLEERILDYTKGLTDRD